MELCKIRKTDHPYVEALLSEAFPPNERTELSVLTDSSEQGLADFWVLREDGRNIGMAYLQTFEDVTQLFYFAVDSSRRGKGFGSMAMKAIMEMYKDACLLVCVEDWKESAGNEEQRLKRHSFYLRCGLGDLPFKLKKDGVVLAVMSNTDAVSPERYRALLEGVLGTQTAETIEIIVG